ncbi:MAG: TlpA family protein disulfide reductase [Pelosinus sp.]|nr:TlpA family protein disulfide reductase [Pelosinus sp.]
MKLNKYLVGIVLLVIAGGLYFYMGQKAAGEQKTAEKTSQGVQIGNLAPDFTLRTLDGQMVNLSDFRGKKVILNFWATWCPPCKAEVPEFEKFYQEQQSDNIEIIAVDITDQEKSKEDVADFIKAYGITYPVVLDEKGTAASTYRISAIPTTYILDAQGIIRQKVTGAMSSQALTDAVTKLK